MKLLLKFNLAFIAIFLGGLAVSALIARNLLQRDAQDDVLDRARFQLEKSSVVSTYTATPGAQVVSASMQRADKALMTVMGLLCVVFVLIGVALNLLLWTLVIQPVQQLSALSDRVSLGELDAPQFSVKSTDEISVLAGSFTRMRKSLVHAMKLLDA